MYNMPLFNFGVQRGKRLKADLQVGDHIKNIFMFMDEAVIHDNHRIWARERILLGQ